MGLSQVIMLASPLYTVDHACTGLPIHKVLLSTAHVTQDCLIGGNVSKEVRDPKKAS